MELLFWKTPAHLYGFIWKVVKKSLKQVVSENIVYHKKDFQMHRNRFY